MTQEIKGQPHLLAAYTCTPLVKIPSPSRAHHVKGTTIAELGNRNRPLDMIAYQKDGKDYLLLANNSRGVMKIPAQRLRLGAEDRRASRAAPGGVGYGTITAMKGVERLDLLDASTRSC